MSNAIGQSVLYLKNTFNSAKELLEVGLINDVNQSIV